LFFYSPLYLEETYAETHYFGYPPFANFTSPTLLEALTRPQYSCLNIWNVAGGCVFYGDLSLVFSKKWVANMTILSPIDTGFYVGCCANTNSPTSSASSAPGFLPLQSSFATLLQEETDSDRQTREEKRGNEKGQSMCGTGVEVNCSAWNGIPGTLNYFDHILLANSQLLGIPLSSLLFRYFQPQSFPTSEELIPLLIGYLEANIAGSIPFPQGISHLEAGTSQLLGGQGREGEGGNLDLLRNWTVTNSWPLVWNAGLAVSKSLTIYFTWDDLDMFLDPFTVTLTTNLTSDKLGVGNITVSQEVFNKLDEVARLYLEGR
jgi:hypothetical protein